MCTAHCHRNVLNRWVTYSERKKREREHEKWDGESACNDENEDGSSYSNKYRTLKWMCVFECQCYAILSCDWFFSFFSFLVHHQCDLCVLLLFATSYLCVLCEYLLFVSICRQFVLITQRERGREKHSPTSDSNTSVNGLFFFHSTNIKFKNTEP